MIPGAYFGWTQQNLWSKVLLHHVPSWFVFFIKMFPHQLMVWISHFRSWGQSCFFIYTTFNDTTYQGTRMMSRRRWIEFEPGILRRRWFFPHVDDLLIIRSHLATPMYFFWWAPASPGTVRSSVKIPFACSAASRGGKRSSCLSKRDICFYLSFEASAFE